MASALGAWIKYRIAGAKRRLLPPKRMALAVVDWAGCLRPHDPKVFCIGIQRTGTTSIGDFCERQLGMVRRGYIHSRTYEWTRWWFEGKLERVFDDPMFKTGQFFDDDPWWCPGVPEILADRFSDAKFVMFERDPDEWFTSLSGHSDGRSPGWTDIHASIYERSDELKSLAHSGASPRDRNGLSLSGMDEHYKRIFRDRNTRIRELFLDRPDRFFAADIRDPDKFRKLAVFLGHEDRAYADVRSNVGRRSESRNENPL